MGFYDIKGRDKRNWVKLKCLYCLANYSDDIEEGSSLRGLEIGELSRFSNSNIWSLYTLLKRWHRWELIKWVRFQYDYGVVSYYCLTPRGKSYLKSAYKWYKPIHLVEDEVETAYNETMKQRRTLWLKTHA